MIYACSGMLLGHEEKPVLSFATTWTDLESPVQSEVSQVEKDKRRVTSHVRTLETPMSRQQRADWRVPGREGRAEGWASVLG